MDALVLYIFELQVTTNVIVTYIWNLVSINHYCLHILVKFWTSIAKIKRMRVLKKFETLEIKANLNNILAGISQLEVCIVPQNVCNAQKHAHIHSNLYMAQMYQMRKMATLRVGVTLTQSCCYGYQSSDGNTFLNLFSIKHYLWQF